MKNMMLIGLVLSMFLLLGACSSSDSNVDDFTKILEDGGYVLTARDQDSIDYYEENQINSKFDLNVDVEKLYIGYVNNNQRWVEVIVLKSVTQAESVKNALVNELFVEDRLILQKEKIVLITYSPETIALFD